jgi:hypothetical protein
VVAGAAAEGVAVGDDVAAVCRPERCQLSLSEAGGPNTWAGVIEASLFVGPNLEHVVRVGESLFQVTSDELDELDTGTEVWVTMPVANVRAVQASVDGPSMVG